MFTFLNLSGNLSVNWTPDQDTVNNITFMEIIKNIKTYKTAKKRKKEEEDKDETEKG